MIHYPADNTPLKGFISTRALGILDYLVALVLIGSQWIFGFSKIDNAAALFLPIFFGALTLVMAIFTNYEASFIKIFPLQLHLILDMVAGFVLLVSPFLWGFAGSVWLPHVLLGLLLMVMAIYTTKSPFKNGFSPLDSRGL